jgi:predicted RNA-binding Zn ribbon-like protein
VTYIKAILVTHDQSIGFTGHVKEDANLSTMTLPAWVSELEDKPAPMPLLLVQSFVNTLDRDNETDRLASDDDARAWLIEAGLLEAPAATRTSTDGLNLARQVRESIRALIGQGQAEAAELGLAELGPAELGPLNTLLALAQPPLDVTPDGQVRLCSGPADRLADALVILLLIIRDAQADGSWERLKLCSNPDCRWAFYDRSHSRRGQWCDMATCGNKIKNRNLRARRAHAQDPGK